MSRSQTEVASPAPPESADASNDAPIACALCSVALQHDALGALGAQSTSQAVAEIGVCDGDGLGEPLHDLNHVQAGYLKRGRQSHQTIFDCLIAIEGERTTH